MNDVEMYTQRGLPARTTFAANRAFLASLDAAGIARYDQTTDRWVLSGTISGAALQQMMRNAANTADLHGRPSKF